MTDTETTGCPWVIHWGVPLTSTTACDRPAHVWDVTIAALPQGFTVEYRGDPHHEGPTGVTAGQRISWQVGDRREYTGPWPGYCPLLPGEPFAGGCVLHAGHHGRCTP